MTIVAEMSRSCSSSQALAQASTPVSRTAAALEDSGDSSFPHRISESVGRDGPFRSFPPSAVAAGDRAGDREAGCSRAERGGGGGLGEESGVGERERARQAKEGEG
ncbi:unnamed protein product [Urochloa humidicola]